MSFSHNLKGPLVHELSNSGWYKSRLTAPITQSIDFSANVDEIWEKRERKKG
jgi:hypothetical protein